MAKKSTTKKPKKTSKSNIKPVAKKTTTKQNKSTASITKLKTPPASALSNAPAVVAAKRTKTSNENMAVYVLIALLIALVVTIIATRPEPKRDSPNSTSDGSGSQLQVTTDSNTLPSAQSEPYNLQPQQGAGLTSDNPQQTQTIAPEDMSSEFAE